MSTSQIYILISIIALAIIAVAVILRRKKGQKPLSILNTLAFLLVFAGIMSISIFVDNRLISYSLFGAGIILSFIDIVKQSKK